MMSIENLLNREVVSKAFVDKLLLSPGDVSEVNVRVRRFNCLNVMFDRHPGPFPFPYKWIVFNIHETQSFTLTWKQARRVEKIWKKLKAEKENESSIASRKALLSDIGYQDVK